MAICSNYNSLTPLEKVEFIGKLVHAVMTDNMRFLAAKMTIQSAEEAGDFDGVTINPNRDGEETIEKL